MMVTLPAEAPDGLSLVVPCYNAGRYLREAVDSIVAQRLEIPHEIVVIDDASDDATTHRVVSDCQQNSIVRVLALPEHGGVQAARNAGVRAARFRFILPLDADDRLSTRLGLAGAATYAEAAASILRADPDVAFVHTFSQMFEGFSGLTISAYPCTEHLVAHKHHVPTSIVYRRQDAVAAGLYDTRVHKWQDWSFGVALLAVRRQRGAANMIGCIPGPHHEYRVHRGSRISATEVSEIDMTSRTVERHADFFRHHFHTIDTSAIAQAVLDAKPTRLIDLMHMAAFDLGQALLVARDRGLVLSSETVPSHIP